MSLAEQLDKDYIAAMKSKNAIQLTTLRLLKTAISNRLVELKRPGGRLEDEEIITLIQKQAKQRNDSIDQFTKAGRQDLADKEAEELEILKLYLPKQMDDAELAQAIEAEIVALNAKSMADMGRVIGSVVAKYKGQVDGKKVSQVVKEKLASL